MRDIYDHLIRISDLVDGYRDLLSGVMDTHLSTVSNRLNVVMKQLTIIATVFLPLSFLTGFFGQNFSWLVAHITGRWPFSSSGSGLELVVRRSACSTYSASGAGSVGRPTELEPRRLPPATPMRRYASGRTCTESDRGAREERGHTQEAADRGHRQGRTDRPTERNDPTDPMDRIDPFELMRQDGVGRVDRPPRARFGTRPCAQSARRPGRPMRSRGLDGVAGRVDHVPAARRRWSAPGRWPCPASGPAATGTAATRCR